MQKKTCLHPFPVLPDAFQPSPRWHANLWAGLPQRRVIKQLRAKVSVTIEKAKSNLVLYTIRIKKPNFLGKHSRIHGFKGKC